MMPLPVPQESEEQWIDRCMSDEILGEDFEDEAQRYQACESLWARTEKSMDTKRIEAKQIDFGEEQGTFTAVFATLDVIDKDGDVIRSGAIDPGRKVRISAYGHESWYGALPVGKGTIQEQGGELVVRGQFFLDASVGRDTYVTVKGLEDLQEWSFGFDITQTSDGEHDGERVRFLERLDVYEVSPVLLGAGVNTRTVAVKEHRRFDEQLSDTIEATQALCQRARSIKALRQAKGKGLSEKSKAKIAVLTAELEMVLADIRTLREREETSQSDGLSEEQKAYLQTVKTVTLGRSTSI